VVAALSPGQCGVSLRFCALLQTQGRRCGFYFLNNKLLKGMLNESCGQGPWSVLSFPKQTQQQSVMEGVFFPLLDFYLIIWHSQCKEFLGDGMRRLLLWVLIPLAIVALEIYHCCSGFGLFFFLPWHMEVASLELMRFVSRFKQAVHTRRSTSRGRLGFF